MGDSNTTFYGPGILALTAYANTDAGLPSPVTLGEVVPLYINSQRNAGSNRFMEGADISVNAYTMTNDMNALELDCNNSSGSAAGAHMHCLQLIGGGLTQHPGTAIQVTAVGSSTSSWNTGIDLTRYNGTGINFNGGDTTATADMLITPPDNSSSAHVIRLYNHDQSSIIFTLSRTGDIIANNVGVNGAFNSNTSAAFTGTIVNGSAWQSFTGAVGCSTSGSAFSVCTSSPIGLSVAFANTNYTLTCTLSNTTGLPVVSSVSKSTGSFTITIANLTAVVATGNYNCTAINHG